MSRIIEKRYYVRTNGYDFIAWSNKRGIDCRDDSCFAEESARIKDNGSYNLIEVEKFLREAEEEDCGSEDAKERCGNVSSIDDLIGDNDVVMTLFVCDDGSFFQDRAFWGIFSTDDDFATSISVEKFRSLSAAVERFIEDYQNDEGKEHYFISGLDDAGEATENIEFESLQVVRGESIKDLKLFIDLLNKDRDEKLVPLFYDDQQGKYTIIDTNNGRDTNKYIYFMANSVDSMSAKEWAENVQGTEADPIDPNKIIEFLPVEKINVDYPIVKKVREKLNWTQLHVSESLNIPISTLRQWEQEVATTSEWTQDLVVEKMYRLKLKEIEKN